MTPYSFETGMIRRARRARTVTAALAAVVAGLWLLTLTVGDTVFSVAEVTGVILGHDVKGASFTVGSLRLPRATLGVLAGFAFGLAGAVFQRLLRNPLASPDVIGINAGAATAAVAAIVLGVRSSTTVSLLAIAAALLTAAVLYALAVKQEFSGTRLILMGIALAAMLESMTSYVLSKASDWDLQTAMRWLTGSLNSASWDLLIPLVVTTAVAIPVILWAGKDLAVMDLGDDAARGLGVPLDSRRICLVGVAVVLLAVATAASGPIAFVAFMAAPIASRLIGAGRSVLIPAALVGAVLVLGADYIGQHAFESRYPVGVITGILGAPYLVFLLIKVNRKGGSL